MELSDNLTRLKKQVEATSEKQYQLRRNIEKEKRSLAVDENELQQNEEEITSVISSILARNAIVEEREREFLRDEINKFSHSQQVMNKNLTDLIDVLTNTTSLDAVYEARRKYLEEDYQRQEESHIKRSEALESHLSGLEKEIDDKTIKLKKLDEEIKKARFGHILYRYMAHVLAFLIILSIIGLTSFGLYKFILPILHK